MPVPVQVRRHVRRVKCLPILPSKPAPVVKEEPENEPEHGAGQEVPAPPVPEDA